MPIIHHDNTVDRCTNGKGAFSSLSAEELFSLDAGSWFSQEFAGERLPSLVDLLATCKELGLTLNLEIKHAADKATDPPTDVEVAHERELATIACQTVKEFGPAPGTLFFSSFSISALEVCQKLLPEIPRSYLVCIIPDTWESTVQRLGCISLNFHHASASREQVPSDAFFSAYSGALTTQPPLLRSGGGNFAQDTDALLHCERA